MCSQRRITETALPSLTPSLLPSGSLLAAECLFLGSLLGLDAPLMGLFYSFTKQGSHLNTELR